MTQPMSSNLVSGAGRPKPPNAGKGRVKGVPNKTTVAVKAALTEAFEELGGVPSLVAWGKANETEFYKLWAKLLPTEVTGPNGGPIPVQANVLAAVALLTPEERGTLRELASKLEAKG